MKMTRLPEPDGNAPSVNSIVHGAVTPLGAWKKPHCSPDVSVGGTIVTVGGVITGGGGVTGGGV